MSAAEYSAQQRLKALKRWSQEDPAANAERGQRGLMAKFLAQVDETAAARGETLTETERARRAECARRAWMTEMALRSARARSLRAQADQIDAEVAAESDEGAAA